MRNGNLVGASNEWYKNLPHLMKLWGEERLVIPSNIGICERGFSKQSAIKSHFRVSLKLDSLDALMRVSLCRIELENMNWRAVLELQDNMRNRRVLSLDQILLEAQTSLHLFWKECDLILSFV